MHQPAGLNDEEAMELMKRSYEQIIEVAEAHQIIVNIEPHGYFTTKPDMMARDARLLRQPYLRLNMDTGNTFIAGQDPVAFLKRFLDRVSHVHVKDVSESLAAAVRGKQTGIAVSHCALGDGVNADNIRKCLAMLRDHGYQGTLSMECEGQGGPMIEQSLAWLRQTLAELKIQDRRIGAAPAHPRLRTPVFGPKIQNATCHVPSTCLVCAVPLRLVAPPKTRFSAHGIPAFVAVSAVLPKTRFRPILPPK